MAALSIEGKSQENCAVSGSSTCSPIPHWYVILVSTSHDSPLRTRLQVLASTVAMNVVYSSIEDRLRYVGVKKKILVIFNNKGLFLAHLCHGLAGGSTLCFLIQGYILKQQLAS